MGNTSSDFVKGSELVQGSLFGVDSMQNPEFDLTQIETIFDPRVRLCMDTSGTGVKFSALLSYKEAVKVGSIEAGSKPHKQDYQIKEFEVNPDCRAPLIGNEIFCCIIVLCSELGLISGRIPVTAIVDTEIASVLREVLRSARLEESDFTRRSSPNLWHDQESGMSNTLTTFTFNNVPKLIALCRIYLGDNLRVIEELLQEHESAKSH